ncbi:MAG: hypothetical protein U0796_17905 [Gemmatales bacterium]
MKRMTLHVTSLVILILSGWAAYYSYCYHEGNASANRSVDLLNEGKLDEAIVEANKAIRLIPDDALGYFVRGAARFHLIQQKQCDNTFVECKQDLEKAQAGSKNEEVRIRAGRFLSLIKAIEDQQSFS